MLRRETMIDHATNIRRLKDVYQTLSAHWVETTLKLGHLSSNHIYFSLRGEIMRESGQTHIFDFPDFETSINIIEWL